MHRTHFQIFATHSTRHTISERLGSVQIYGCDSTPNGPVGHLPQLFDGRRRHSTVAGHVNVKVQIGRSFVADKGVRTGQRNVEHFTQRQRGHLRFSIPFANCGRYKNASTLRITPILTVKIHGKSTKLTRFKHLTVQCQLDFVQFTVFWHIFRVTILIGDSNRLAINDVLVHGLAGFAALQLPHFL